MSGTSPHNPLDPTSDLSSRLNTLAVADDYPSISPSHQSPASQQFATQHPHTPTPRHPHFPLYPTTDESGQYLYYPQSIAPGQVGHFSPTHPQTATYPYGGPPPDLLQHPQMQMVDPGAFSTLGETYSDTRQQQHQPMTPVSHGQGGGMARAGGVGYRPPHGQAQVGDGTAYFNYGLGDARGQYWGMYGGGGEGGNNQGKGKKTTQLAHPMQSPLPQTPMNRFNQPHNYPTPPHHTTPSSGNYLATPHTPHGTHNPYAVGTPQTPAYGHHGQQAYGGYATPASGAQHYGGHVGQMHTWGNMGVARGTGARKFGHGGRGHAEEHIPRSALLEDFRLNKMNQRYELKDVFGHIVEFSGDQHGSRFLQQKLETCTVDERQQLFDEIMPNAYQLMTDVFGNYVTQKLFEQGDQRQKAALAKKMEGHVLSLSMQMYGCRVVQKALEHVLNDQRATLMAELEPNILDCVKSSNANHVIQKMVTLDPPDSLCRAFAGHVEELATHPYGCRVLQKIIENLPEEKTRELLDEMHLCSESLMEDQFGNYVVQSVIVMGKPDDRDKVVAKIKGRVVALARHKFASNVCEKALTQATDADRRELIAELIDLQPNGDHKVRMLLRDAFGNFPLQTALHTADPEQRQQLLDLIIPELPAIRHTPVGKRLEAKISQMQLDVSSSLTEASSTNPASPRSVPEPVPIVAPPMAPSLSNSSGNTDSNSLPSRASVSGSSTTALTSPGDRPKLRPTNSTPAPLRPAVPHKVDGGEGEAQTLEDLLQ